MEVELKETPRDQAEWMLQTKGLWKASQFQFALISDTSENGYNQVTYLRLVNSAGNVQRSLVTAKSRAASMK